jgi:hypothetical protein
MMDYKMMDEIYNVMDKCYHMKEEYWPGAFPSQEVPNSESFLPRQFLA